MLFIPIYIYYCISHGTWRKYSFRKNFRIWVISRNIHFGALESIRQTGFRNKASVCLPVCMDVTELEYTNGLIFMKLGKKVTRGISRRGFFNLFFLFLRLFHFKNKKNKNLWKKPALTIFIKFYGFKFMVPIKNDTNRIHEKITVKKLWDKTF